MLGPIDGGYVLPCETGLSVCFSVAYLGALIDSLYFPWIFYEVILLINPIIILHRRKIPLIHLIRTNNPSTPLKVLQHRLFPFLIKILLPKVIPSIFLSQRLHFMLIIHIPPFNFLIPTLTKLFLLFLEFSYFSILLV